MGKTYVLVKEKPVRLKDLSYDDLVWLFNNYISVHGNIPLTTDCTTANNLPHDRHIKRILSNANVTYNDFMNQFGKLGHVRSSIENYDIYLQRYKSVSNDIGHGLTISELKQNMYGLPSAKWFVDNCPNPKVTSFDDFVIWTGFNSNKPKRDKEDIVTALKEYEKKINRPITRQDINKANIGFSMIVINRIWGGLGKCKQELGLMKTLPTQPKPFEYYKKVIDDFIISILNRDIKFTTWKEIEDATSINHKTFVKSFTDNGKNFYQYISSHGIQLNPNSFGYTSILDSGEKITSSYEYIFSTYLSSIGYKYNVDYKRDVMYKTFLPLSQQSKMNCDYVIDDKYIEIAGIIDNKDNNWENRNYKYKTHIRYQKKMLVKQQLLQENNKQFLFLFPEDFDNNEYQNKFQRFIGKEVLVWEP